MTRPRTAVAAIVVWLVVATGGALLVWTVISHAGEGVAGDLPSASVEPAPTDTRSSEPSEPAEPAEPSQSGEPAGEEPVRGSWQGAAGVVVAVCEGSAISLGGAQPAAGWRVEVDDRGPDRVRVEFETVDSDSEQEARTRVEAVCMDGTPTFDVED